MSDSQSIQPAVPSAEEAARQKRASRIKPVGLILLALLAIGGVGLLVFRPQQSKAPTTPIPTAARSRSRRRWRATWSRST